MSYCTTKTQTIIHTNDEMAGEEEEVVMLATRLSSLSSSSSSSLSSLLQQQKQQQQDQAAVVAAAAAPSSSAPPPPSSSSPLPPSSETSYFKTFVSCIQNHWKKKRKPHRGGWIELLPVPLLVFGIVEGASFSIMYALRHAPSNLHCPPSSFHWNPTIPGAECDMMPVSSCNQVNHHRLYYWAQLLCLICSFVISYLVHMLLVQRELYLELVAKSGAQEAKVRREHDMTSYFAHELRNPLSAIDSALNAMPDDAVLPESASELLSGMKLCTSFMSDVMNNLLDARQIEEGKLTLQRMPMELDTVIQDIHRMFLPKVHTDVKFECKSNRNVMEVAADATSLENWVIGDVHRIKQVFTNVISNAIKYTTSGSITVSIGWDDADDHDDDVGNSSHAKQQNATSKRRVVRFECTDTGPGIPKHVQAQLFERFVKRGGAPGTGLGLAISKQIVDLMNGSIYFESDPTVKPGSTCIVLLPLEPCLRPEDDDDNTDDDSSSLSSSSSIQEASAPIQEASAPGTPCRSSKFKSLVDEDIDISKPITEDLSILIVDDIKMNRMMLKRRFLKAIAPNSIISEATTGEEAIELCKHKTYDVIIMDQYMESAGGVLLGTDTVIALIRMGVQSLIIGCSGNDMKGDFQAVGADCCWQKPLPNNETIIAQLRQRRRRLN